MKRKIKLLFCMFGHTWTCAANEGVEATEEQVRAGQAGFDDYAKMYCKRCDRVYQPEI